jgi:hypothetical protein
MNDRELAFVVKILQRRERRMQSVEAVQIDGALVARGGLGDGDRRS